MLDHNSAANETAVKDIVNTWGLVSDAVKDEKLWQILFDLSGQFV